MRQGDLDLGKGNIPSLFRAFFIPTLIGMLSICALTAIDGIFIGHGVGSDGLAAVNIGIAPTMFFAGMGLMLGVGASVVSSVSLADGDVKTARKNITQSLFVSTVIVIIFCLITLTNREAVCRLLGSNDYLLPLVSDYIIWIFPTMIFQIWTIIGLFVVRLDGSPRYAMWCNLLPALVNIILDYLFIFPLGMGLYGAALATFIACGIGGVMVLLYITLFAKTLRFVSLCEAFGNTKYAFVNLLKQSKIGVSALLGEATMGMLMFVGNIAFMEMLGNSGVGAFSIACYYTPFIFMVGNAIAQSVQPILSYNYRLSLYGRVSATERLAIITALCIGAIVMLSFILFSCGMVSLFLDDLDSETAKLAVSGLAYYSVAFIFFIFNLTAIGFFQSVERVLPSVVFAMLRGIVFLIPSFFIIPQFFGVKGLWLCLAVSEALTSLCIVAYYLHRRYRKRFL